MKTEEILRYQTEFEEMEKAFGTPLLVFECQRQESNDVNTKVHPTAMKRDLRESVGAKHLP